MKTPTRAVIVGGFSTGEMALEPVGQAAIALGIARDFDTFTFPYAMEKPWEVASAARDQIIITHSAGALAISQSVLLRPSEIITCNGPEPRPKKSLVNAATRKIVQHTAGLFTESGRRRAYARVMASNALEATLHPYGNMRHLSSISAFSTTGYLASIQRCKIASVQSIVTEGDTFFPYDPGAVLSNIRTHVVPGGHDELLISPEDLLQELVEKEA